MKKFGFALLAVSALAVTASAQQVSTYTFEAKVASDETQQVLLDKVRLEQGLKVALESRVITNAPYSAETVNESIQVLPDGNRIVHRASSRVYRDSAGRTRRETLDDGGQVVLIAISDPTTGTSTVFDPRGNTVGNSVVTLRTAPGEGGTSWTAAQATMTGVPSSGASTIYLSSAAKQQAELAASGNVKVRSGVVGGVAGGTAYYLADAAPAKYETTKEDLGQQTVEGVTATGTRTSTVIPAGAIGNEQPIKIVSEEWTSPELQVLVLTKHSDPRTGETSYRLTGVTRTEPAKSLFEVPAGK